MINSDTPAYIRKCPDFANDFWKWFLTTYPGFNYDAFVKLGFNIQVGVIWQFLDSVEINVECYSHYQSHRWRISVHNDDEFKPDELSMLIEYFGSTDFIIEEDDWINSGGVVEFKSRAKAMYIAIHLAMMDYADYLELIKESKTDNLPF